MTPTTLPVRAKVIWKRTGALARAIAHAALAAAVVAVSADTAGAGTLDRHLREQLAQRQGPSRVAVLVTVRPDAGPRTAERLRRLGVRTSRDFSIVRTFAATLPRPAVRALAQDPDVLSVSADATVVPSAMFDTATLNMIGGDSSALFTTTTSTSSSGDSNFSTTTNTSDGSDSGTFSNPLIVRTPLNLLRATLGLTSSKQSGSGVTVAVIDSGIAPVGDLKSQLLVSYDFTQGGKLVAASDQYGHGTHVAGLIGGNGSASGGLYGGVAPSVRFVSLRVLDGSGAGSTANVISAIQFAVAQKSKLGIKVINLSLGHPIFEPAASDPLVQAVEAAVRAGIVVVAAAGNYGVNPATGQAGYAGLTSPGNAPSVLTIGAQQLNGTPVLADDVVPIYSSRGPTWYDGFVKPDVVAPGHRQVAPTAPNSTLANLFAASYPQFLVNNGQYMVLSGTSMATGVASGMVAQVLAQRPGLTPAAVKAILQYTASPVRDAATGAPYDLLTQGVGAITGSGALALATAIDTTMPAGAYWLRWGVVPGSTIAGEWRPWSQSLIWGVRQVTGTTIDVNQVAWANNIVWGTNVVWGSNIVWGTNVVWGSNIVWGTNVVWGSSLVGDTTSGSNVVWGSNTSADNVVWGSLSTVGGLTGSNVVWGTTATSGVPKR